MFCPFFSLHAWSPLQLTLLWWQAPRRSSSRPALCSCRSRSWRTSRRCVMSRFTCTCYVSMCTGWELWSRRKFLTSSWAYTQAWFSCTRVRMCVCLFNVLFCTVAAGCAWQEGSFYVELEYLICAFYVHFLYVCAHMSVCIMETHIWKVLMQACKYFWRCMPSMLLLLAAFWPFLWCGAGDGLRQQGTDRFRSRWGQGGTQEEGQQGPWPWWQRQRQWQR